MSDNTQSIKKHARFKFQEYFIAEQKVASGYVALLFFIFNCLIDQK